MILYYKKLQLCIRKRKGRCFDSVNIKKIKMKNIQNKKNAKLAIEKELEELKENKTIKLLYILWLIKKYKLPYYEYLSEKEQERIDTALEELDNYKNGRADMTAEFSYIEQKQYKDIDDKISKTAFIMRDICKKDMENSDVNETTYLAFLNTLAEHSIYSEKYDSLNDYVIGWIEKQNDIEKKNAADIFAKYLCNCMMFDRGIPDRGRYYWFAAENFIYDIENTAHYNLKNTTIYWSLLCSTAGSYDDVFPSGNIEEYVNKTVQYINKALEVREELHGIRDNDFYFQSEAYAIDLNNIGYTLLDLDGNDYLEGEYRNCEKFVREIYDEVVPLINKISSPRLKSLIISNLGAIEGKYGNHISAVRYDLKALEIKQNVVANEQYADADSMLTIIKSHLNIVNNSLMAIFEMQFLYGIKSNDTLPPISEMDKYIRLIGIHAIEAVRMRKKINSDRLALCNSYYKEGFPTSTKCGIDLNRAIRRLLEFLKYMDNSLSQMIKEKENEKEKEKEVLTALIEYRATNKTYYQYIEGIDEFLKKTFKEYNENTNEKIEASEIAGIITKYKRD